MKLREKARREWKVWRKFNRAMRFAPAGTRFEVGASYNAGHGWRPYYRLGAGAACVFLSPAEARGLVALVDGFKVAPAAWRLAPAVTLRLFDELKRAADDCDRKNKSGEIMLPGMVAEQPA